MSASTVTFPLSENIQAGMAVTPDGNGAYKRFSGTGLIAGVLTQSGTAGSQADGVPMGPVPDGFFGKGNATFLVRNPATGAIERGVKGRRLGWTDAEGNGFFLPTVGYAQAVNVEDYGAVPDADGSATSKGRASRDGGNTEATPNADLFEAAIRSIDPVRGGIVRIGFGGYRIERTINVDRPVTIEGQGHAEIQANLPGTVLYADKRVTCFRFVQSGVLLDNLTIKQVARDDDPIVGSFQHDTRQVMLASPGNFYDGQLIEIPGAGNRFRLSRLKATTASGEPYAFISGGDKDASRGLKVGLYYIIDKAFPNPTAITGIRHVSTREDTEAYALYDVVRPLSPNGHIYLVVDIGIPPHLSGALPPVFPTNGTTVSDGNLTFLDLGLYDTNEGTLAIFESNAAIAVVETPLILCSSRDCRIVSGAETTTLVVDSNFGWPQDLTDIPIRDASAAVDMKSRGSICRLHVDGFQGPAVAILAGGHYVPACNANLWTIFHLDAFHCRNAVIARGADSQAGRAYGVEVIQSREFGIIDDTQAGNLWSATHCDGGYGRLTSDVVDSHFEYAYTESGTFNSFGARTTWSHTQSPDAGGVGISSGAWNTLAVGASSVHTHQLYCEPDGNWLRLTTRTDGTGVTIRRTNMAADGTSAGYVIFEHTPGQRRTPIAITAADGPNGYARGTLILPQGFLMGCTGGGLLDPSVASRFFVGDAEPGDERFDATSTEAVWRPGDILFVTGKELHERAGLLRCIRGGHSAPLWRAGKPVVLGERMRLPADDGFYYEAKSIGDLPHRTGATEPVSGVTISDGDISWARQAPRALFERVGQVVLDTPHIRQRSRFKRIQTNTATPSQVILSGTPSEGGVAGEDFAIPDDAVTVVADRITVHEPGTANGGDIEIRSTWIHNRVSMTQIGKTMITCNLSGTVLDETAIMHAANKDAANKTRIELLASPKSNETLEWRVFRTQSEGID